MANNKHKPVLIIIAGPNGSGKTTITSRILQHEWLEDSLYINPDNVAQNIFGDWNNQDAVLKAAQYCQAQREECLQNNHSMIFETVMSTEEKIKSLEKDFSPAIEAVKSADLLLFSYPVYARLSCFRRLIRRSICLKLYPLRRWRYFILLSLRKFKTRFS